MVHTIVNPPLTPKPKKVGQRRRWVMIVLTVLAMAGLGGSAYFYSQYRQVKANPDAVAQKEVNEVVATVGKLMVLPADETPTVATISDKTKLTDQAFFKTSANGDKLLVYNGAMLAILYRPDNNKIITVAPISVNQPTAVTNTSNTNRK